MCLPKPIGAIEYIYSDDHIIVVSKPANMLSVPGKLPEKHDCLIHRVQNIFPKALIVHRLDFSTSGLLVIAHNRDAHRELSRQFQDRETKKIYIAEVFGMPNDRSGLINLPLRCDWDRRPRQIVDFKHGKTSQTFWKMLSRFENTCRLKLKPITGRSHQIRVHMQAFGHPILGDDLYAHERAFTMTDRLYLHAKELTITHPAKKSCMTFKSIEPF